ncbi:histidinol dehydrogenase HisD [Clostridium aceticum]|uniref:Histidinol dehydrogenase n=1 Tax=Clostridium aceticum TaxID=84022 RepID=A0A0D8I679_9CLOT|nr:histidinol dehydrogenase [Clostridium aceticum]AKL93696.1 histidinol dehydrogenase HisD [Clostridium aceticum]KJF25748.1 histidinol dehydrogenase [Clostridium aceticum]
MIDIINGSKDELFATLKERSTVDFKDYQPQVDEILQGIQERGDEALLEYTKKFDGAVFTPQQIAVTEEEFQGAYDEVAEGFVAALRLAIKNIREYHEKQKQNSWFTSSEGVFLGQKVSPIASVGIYVPGGTAAYPSSVLMNALPAIVAGVKRIVMVTPPGKEGKLSPGVLVAAKELGIKEVYKVGGAQAVGALAFGTQSIPKVDKIVGPGNIYVATAKRAVYGYVDIDMIAGPSEILVLADESANPRYVAADLLSQAEHDPLASSLLITTSEVLAEEVKEEVLRQTALLERKEIIEKSLKDYGKIILVKNLEEAVAFANEIAPEHLELCVEKPFEVLNSIENAGAIFLGHYTPEPLGDYLAGPNHVLPTSGTAKFYSPLSVEDYMKKSSVIYYSQEALKKVKDEVMILAEAEGLTAHKNSIKVRYEEND